LIETLHPGGLTARSYSGDVIELRQGPCALSIETDVLRAIVHSHGEDEEARVAAG
jgi:hypothetical protein